MKVHVKSILRKIQVANRTQAAIWAMQNGYFADAAQMMPKGCRPRRSKWRSPIEYEALPQWVRRKNRVRAGGKDSALPPIGLKAWS